MIKTVFKIKFIFVVTLLISLQNVKSDEYEIKAENIEYKNKNLIIANGNANAKKSTGELIYSDKIIYAKDKGLIETYGNSKFIKGLNIIEAKQFKYDLNSKIIIAQGNVKFTDSDNNKFLFNYFKYFQKTQKGYGDKIQSYSSDGSYLMAKEGMVDNNKNISILNDVNYTTCKKIKNNKEEFCPSWSLNSKKTIHDKNKKRIIHKNTFLKIKKLPVFYTPYLSHPDPSVKRQSGFLPPLIRTISNVGRTLKTPYYWVLSEDKDITITPVYYFDQNHMLNSSYRQALKNGSLMIEHSFTKGYKNTKKLNRTPGSRSYFFLEYKNNIKNVIYENNDITFKIQNVSQQNYLRVNKLKTKLFDEDIRSLANTINIKTYENNKYIDIETGYYKNLDIGNKKNQITYYLPKGSYSYNKNNIKKFNFNFNSFFEGKKFLGSQKHAKMNNIFKIDSKKYISKNGIDTVLKANFYNKNNYNKNVASQENGTNSKNNITFALDNSYPLVKYGKNGYDLLKPRLFIKYTSGSMQNATNLNKILNYNDIYSMNRTNSLETLETGTSVGYGLDYSKTKNKDDNYEKFYKSSFGIGQVINKKDNQNMPLKSSLNNSSSDFAGYLKFNLYGDKNKYKIENNKINFIEKFKQNYLSINYNYNVNSNFNDLNQNSIKIENVYKKFYSSFTLNEKKAHIGNIKTAEINIKKLISENYFLSVEGKRNLKNSQSEYHRLSLNFENDCIVTSLSLSKNFYYDKDIRNSKNLIFSVLLKPFSDNFGPDLTDFIN